MRRTANRNRDDYCEWVGVQPIPDPFNFWTPEEKEFIRTLVTNNHEPPF